MSLGLRLKQERERLGLSQTALASACGVGKTTQINYEKDVRSPDAHYLLAAREAGIDTHWVLFGESAALDGFSVEDRQPSSYGGEAEPSRAYSHLAKIPLYDVEGAAGAGRTLESEEVVGHFTLDADTTQQLGIHGVRLVGVRVRGDSMIPTLADGDWVVINLDDVNVAQAGVFLIWVSGELRIKRLQRVAGGAVLLISDNKVYEREMIAPDQMHEFAVLGRVMLRLGEIS
ncbi:XRE family transcriptional regulator [Carnimonas bestiolae]|uniref:XRE family transcriptional regulator n=1 Tax=Carnimonas bestiolae TaxID=3402172 RepID=UPI003EDBFCD8